MDPSRNPGVFHATTIVSVRREGRVAVAGDGQVTLGNTVMKANARKVRRLDRDGLRIQRGVREQRTRRGQRVGSA